MNQEVIGKFISTCRKDKGLTAINYYYLENKGTGVGLLIALAGLIMFVIYFTKHYEIKLK